MNKLLSFLIIISFFIFYSSRIEAQMDPKAKTVVVMSAYGTVGGALLGLATLAFKSSPRAIPVGASLGLYAGLLFGSYIVVTHEMRKRGMYQEENYYPEAPPTPYDRNGGESTPYENSSPNPDGAYRWDPKLLQEEYAWKDTRINPKNQAEVFSISLLDFRF